MSFELIAIICLVALAFGDLIVGVVNDAVNFLSSAIGSKVASRNVIMAVAGIGMIVGATFSDGIMEVARKGIFHPEMFGASEVIIIFLAVALSDIILLDIYSTLGLPTSTTVSIVFELLGSALFFAIWKMGGVNEAWSVVNSESAIKIITGILVSIAVAFTAGLIVQFVTRLIFSFNYKKRLSQFGFIWSGIALTCLLFFIFLKGGINASFLSADMHEWINSHIMTILWWTFGILTALSLVLIKSGVNILKLIVLIGTGALGMAFAGNDLANFIGVSVAGVHAFLGSDLSGSLPTPTWVLASAGIVMTITIFTSKKARTVTSTSVDLASHNKKVMGVWKTNVGVEKVIDLALFIYNGFLRLIPKKIRGWIAKQWLRDPKESHHDFDLMRAAVNLMVAAAAISLATSMKLPLSTTYVTFMVAMGTALADGAWDRTCAPYRIVGVMTVIGGWFLTALFAFLMAGFVVSILYWLHLYGLALLILATTFIVYKLLKLHKRRTLA